MNDPIDTFTLIYEDGSEQTISNVEEFHLQNEQQRNGSYGYITLNRGGRTHRMHVGKRVVATYSNRVHERMQQLESTRLGRVIRRVSHSGKYRKWG